MKEQLQQLGTQLQGDLFTDTPAKLNISFQFKCQLQYQ
jgi:hypothetical protein